MVDLHNSASSLGAITKHLYANIIIWGAHRRCIIQIKRSTEFPGMKNFGLKGSTEHQNNNKWTGEGRGGVRYRAVEVFCWRRMGSLIYVKAIKIHILQMLIKFM